MINKEIEKLLDCDNCKLKECIGCDITYIDRKAIREYIEQLESNKQKLIEKLGETRNNLEKNGFVGYADEVQEILEIMKGEKEGGNRSAI